ncbi:MAG TPA: hypothetical protein ACFYDZ_10335 [Candidatus Brocadiaceae bacterium]
MEKFLERYHSKIIGVISTFDRMIFKGHILPFFQKSQRHWYLFQEKVFSKGYYWVLDQGEYATDVMFKDRQSLEEIYPELVEHALVNFNATDVMTFLGRKHTGNFQGEMITDTKKRP